MEYTQGWQVTLVRADAQVITFVDDREEAKRELVRIGGDSFDLSQMEPGGFEGDWLIGLSPGFEQQLLQRGYFDYDDEHYSLAITAEAR